MCEEKSVAFHATATTFVGRGPSRVDACLSKRSLCFGGSTLDLKVSVHCRVNCSSILLCLSCYSHSGWLCAPLGTVTHDEYRGELEENLNEDTHPDRGGGGNNKRTRRSQR